MSRQQGGAPDVEQAGRKTPGRKDRPWSLWVTYKWLGGETRTFRNRRYRTEKEARDAGAQLMRKYPAFYISFDVELDK